MKPPPSVASTDDRYWPADQVARILSVHKRTVIKWIRCDVLHNCRLLPGAGYRVPKSEVSRLLDDTRLPDRSGQ